MGVLEGKVAVITGSSHGLGLAIAQAFAREGAAVVLAARSETSLNRAVDALTQQGLQASGLPTDVGDLSQVQALADHAIRKFGKIDIWVNNAGIGVFTVRRHLLILSCLSKSFEQISSANIMAPW